MTDRRKPNRHGSMATVFAALLFYSGITAWAGSPAAVWFALGFIVASLIAFWEAGRHRTNGETNA